MLATGKSLPACLPRARACRSEMYGGGIALPQMAGSWALVRPCDDLWRLPRQSPPPSPCEAPIKNLNSCAPGLGALGPAAVWLEIC